MGPLELVYYLGYSFKKSRGLKNRKRLPHRVISIGNLTVGGTGKTPAVIAVASEARRRGFFPCILTRGYKGRAKGPCIISRGNGPLLDADEAGDEALLMAEKVRGVPVIKGSDRYEAGLFAIRELRSSVAAFPSRFLFILDDGYQHWKLCRDVDVLLIDSTNPFGNNRLLPMGPLREPLSEMRRAGIIVLTRRRKETASDLMLENLENEIRRYNPDAPIFSSGHAPAGLGTVSGGALPPDALAGKRVFAFCGIGNPAAFRNTLAAIGADVRGFTVFRDHHVYSLREMDRIMESAKTCEADWIVTTEKDIMKLRNFDVSGNLVSLRIEFEVDKGFYERLFPEA